MNSRQRPWLTLVALLLSVPVFYLFLKGSKPVLFWITVVVSAIMIQFIRYRLERKAGYEEQIKPYLSKYGLELVSSSPLNWFSTGPFPKMHRFSPPLESVQIKTHRPSKPIYFRVLAPTLSITYLEGVVKQPFINVEEKIDRFVGKRTKTPNGLSTTTSRKEDSIAWRKGLGGVRVPRGVFRFKTHEEADQWLWRMICRPRS